MKFSTGTVLAFLVPFAANAAVYASHLNRDALV